MLVVQNSNWLYPSFQEFKKTLGSISHSKLGKIFYIDTKVTQTKTQSTFQTLFQKFKGLIHFEGNDTANKSIEESAFQIPQEEKHEEINSFDTDVLLLSNRVALITEDSVEKSSSKLTITKCALGILAFLGGALFIGTYLAKTSLPPSDFSLNRASSSPSEVFSSINNLVFKSEISIINDPTSEPSNLIQKEFQILESQEYRVYQTIGIAVAAFSLFSLTKCAAWLKDPGKSTIEEVPSEELRRLKAFDEIKPFLRENEYPENLPIKLERFNALSLGQKRSCLALANSFRDIFSSSSMHYFLDYPCSFDVDHPENKEVIMSLKEFAGEFKSHQPNYYNDNAVVALILNIFDLPLEKRKSAISIIINPYNDFEYSIFYKYNSSFLFLIKMYQIIPLDQNQFDLIFIEKLSKALKWGSIGAEEELYRDLQVVCEEERFSILKDVILSHQGGAVCSITSILACMRKRSIAELNAYIQKYLDLYSSGNDLYRILSSLEFLNIELNENILDRVIKLSSNIVKSGYVSLDVFLKIINSFDYNEISLIIDFIRSNSNKREISLSHLLDISKICMITSLPYEELSIKEEIIAEWLNVKKEEFDARFDFLNILAPECRLEELQKFHSIQDFFKLFTENSIIRESSFQYLRKVFVQDISPRRIHLLVDVLLKYHEELQLPADILDKVLVFTSALANPNSLKDPVRIYNELKQINNREFLQVEGQTCDIDGHVVRFDLNTLRQRKSHQLSFKDLPANIDRKTLKRLFENWKGHFDSLSKEDQEKIENTIDDSITFPTTQSPLKKHVIDNLKEVIFSLSEIKRLFSLAKNPTEVFDSFLYYLYMSIKAINEESSDLQEDCLLTAQEDKLLRFCIQIGFEKKGLKCSTGQKDGLSDFYNTLSSEYRLKHVKGRSSNEAKVEDFVHSMMDPVIELTLAKESVLRELTEEKEKISQQSHQTLYLKNLLCKQLVMLHKLTFDLHTETLYKKLLKLNLEKTLKIILRYLTFTAFDRLKYDISQELSKVKRIEFELSTAIEEQKKLSPSDSQINQTLEKRRKEGVDKQAQLAKERENELDEKPSHEIQDIQKIHHDIQKIHHEKWLSYQLASEQKEEQKEVKEDSRAVIGVKKRIESLESVINSYPVTYATLKDYIKSKHKNFEVKDYFIFDEENHSIGLTSHGVISLLQWTGYLQIVDGLVKEN